MTPHVLLLGGHGKVSQRMTPMLLSKSWTVTSLIRKAEQISTIEALGKGQPGKLNVLVSSLEDVNSEQKARAILDSVGASWVIWSAGAGGRGGLAVTRAVDDIAARSFISAAASAPSISHFLMVSWPGSRQTKPAWFSDGAWQKVIKTKTEVLPDYAAAKLRADEHLTAVAADARAGFHAVCLRPGTLSLEDERNVALGKVDGGGEVSRATVARVVAELFAHADGWKGGRCTWLDLMDGDEVAGDAVQRCLKDGVDAVEGEDVERMKREAETM